MSVRDEMAWGLAKKLFPSVPWDQLSPLKQSVCLELADALMPIVERVAAAAAIQGVKLGSSAGMGEAFHRHIDEIVRRVVEGGQ